MWTFAITLLIVGFYCVLVYQLLFSTNTILDKLKLDEGFLEDEFSFKISTAAILTLAIMITGGIILLNTIPDFFRLLFAYYQQSQARYNVENNPQASYIVFAAIKIIIGLLMIGERNKIVSFIENKNTSRAEEVEEEPEA